MLPPWCCHSARFSSTRSSMLCLCCRVSRHALPPRHALSMLVNTLSQSLSTSSRGTSPPRPLACCTHWSIAAISASAALVPAPSAPPSARTAPFAPTPRHTPYAARPSPLPPGMYEPSVAHASVKSYSSCSVSAMFARLRVARPLTSRASSQSMRTAAPLSARAVLAHPSQRAANSATASRAVGCIDAPYAALAVERSPAAAVSASSTSSSPSRLRRSHSAGIGPSCRHSASARAKRTVLSLAPCSRSCASPSSPLKSCPSPLAAAAAASTHTTPPPPPPPFASAAAYRAAMYCMGPWSD